jgi:hypothetical protein
MSPTFVGFLPIKENVIMNLNIHRYITRQRRGAHFEVYCIRVEATLHIKFPRIYGGPVKVPNVFGGHLIIFIGTKCKILPLLRSRQIFMPKVKPLAMGFYHV